MSEVASAIHEQSAICPVSVEAAAVIGRSVLESLADSGSVLHAVVAARRAGFTNPVDLLADAPLLSVDPYRTGTVVPRYMLQSGELPIGGSANAAPEQALSLWISRDAGMPKLAVPNGRDDDIMAVADSMQMRGGGPVIFARETVATMPKRANAWVRIDGAARNAPKERIASAVAYAAAQAVTRPIIATVDPTRFLAEPEREAVSGYAPEARNELELMVDAAISQDFMADPTNRYGVRYLADGSAYTELRRDNGQRLVILAPQQNLRVAETGLSRAYKAIGRNPELLGSGFQIDGSNVVQVTSTFYGTSAAMNNLRAVHEERLQLGSYEIVGDNQAARGPQAHLVEIGFTAVSLSKLLEDPNIGPVLNRRLARDPEVAQ